MALALMRRHRRWLYVFLWVVIAAFILLYVPALQNEHTGTPGETVVGVGGLPITVGEFQRAYFRQRQVYDRLSQGRLDQAMQRQIQQQVLESLVADRLVELEAKRLGIAVSDDAVSRAIPAMPEYQDDGRFIGAAELRRRLDLQGMSEEQFAESVRTRLKRDSLAALVGSAASVSDAEVENETRRRTEQVRLEYVQVDAARFQTAIQPTEEEIAARFAARPQTYRLPEKRVVSYILLDAETLRKRTSVTDRETEVYYQDHREDFREEEQACASHILVKVKQGDASEGHEAAEAAKVAQDLLEQVKAGADFAAVARKASEDKGSAQNGGDLGCFPPGRMVREFDEAVFAMQPGQTSDLVKTSFGYHIIRLASKRESTVLPLAQAKGRIQAILLDRKASDLGETTTQAITQLLAKGRTLAEVAQAEGLVVKKSEPFARSGAIGDLASPALAARVFELKAGQVEKTPFAVPQGVAFVALDAVQPSRAPELKEVRAQVREDIVEEAAFQQARSLAASLKAKAASAGLDRAAAAAGLVRKETPQLTGRGQSFGDLGSGFSLDQAAFALPEKTLSDPVRTTAGWAVLRVIERKVPDLASQLRDQAQAAASLREQKRTELVRAFLVEARDRYLITRNPSAYKRALGEPE